MKYISIVLVALAFAALSHADEALIWKSSNGAVIAHGDALAAQDDWVKCGDRKLKGFADDKISAGTVETWVEGAENISQLGTVTTISWDDLRDDASQASEDTQALLEVVAELTGTSVDEVREKFKIKKKQVKADKKAKEQ